MGPSRSVPALSIGAACLDVGGLTRVFAFVYTYDSSAVGDFRNACIALLEVYVQRARNGSTGQHRRCADSRWVGWITHTMPGVDKLSLRDCMSPRQCAMCSHKIWCSNTLCTVCTPQGLETKP